MPRISVVIPSYNHAVFISDAVDSVLAQSESDLELIVVDDGSTDNTLEVLSGYTDLRLKVIPQENRGAHAAINRGLKETRGDYLSILNSDDFYHPRRLEEAITVFKSDPNVGLVGSYIKIIDKDNNELGIKHGYKDCEPWMLDEPQRSFRAGEDLRAALLTENFWSTTSNYAFTRTHYEQVGEFRPLRYAHDWDFALRMARVAQMVLLPEPLVNYRVHDKNTIREDQAAMIFEICWILAVHLLDHIEDAGFFNQMALNNRIDQLLHSIYVYDCERVLSVMLLHQLHKDTEGALKLLQPDDPTRAEYLHFIIHKLKDTHIEDSARPGTAENQILHQPDLIKSNFRRFISRIRSGKQQ